MAGDTTDYRILISDDHDSLAHLVRQHLAEGWRPMGGVAVGLRPTGLVWRLYQAVVREPSSGEASSRGAIPPTSGPPVVHELINGEWVVPV